MKRVLIENLPLDTPCEIASAFKGARVYDSSCSPEARVYFIDTGEGFYLKTAKKGTLSREAEMSEYFYKKGFSQGVASYVSLERDWLLTRKVAGEDCTHSAYLSNPCRLADLMGEMLRQLHSIDASDCPVQDRVREYIGLAEANYSTGNYDRSAFPDSFGYKNAEEAYKVFNEGKHLLKSDTLIHGDYCLPNIMLKDWSFSGFIDTGNGGIGDRHIDLFWGCWTLWFNLKTNKYRDRFLDAYGRDKVDDDILRIIASAEVFG
ncbi:MAG: aminoglycoside 3'-phosphotransferase [Clostridia bacterium]|nr:aminoglycoside 3'-phosphotransferase [Clostridia bacterium]